MNKFIVLDINHGGDYLAAILKNRGYEVIVYDIYHKGGEKKQKLNEKNIRVFENMRGDHLGYTIAFPVHCPEQFFSLFPNNNKITHHELVKLLFNHRKKIIEITGSKGKTTTANLLAFLLSFEEEILLNNSTGFQSFINGNPKLIDKENSISAGYTAKILSEEYNKVHVLEESLGVCGVGDVSILTSMDPIYNIKAGNGNSVDAKKQLFKLSENKIIIDSKDKIANNIANEYKKEVFRIGEDINIITPDTLEVGKDVNSTIYIKDLELIPKLKGSYLLAGYVNPILFSVMTLKILDKDLENVTSNLSSFDGVKNRLSVIIENSITKIIDKSGGFSEASLRYLLSLLKRHYDIYYKNINLLIDVNNVSHCQKIDLNALDAVIGEFGNLVDNAFLVGNYDFERFKYLKNSSELITQKGDLLIECGK